MRFKYNHGGETCELAVAETKLTSPTGVVRHNNANNYVPLINLADKNASHLRVRHNGNTYAPIRYLDEPINMLNGRTLADVKAIFQSGLGKYYFKASDYFDVTFPNKITLDAGSIAADSTWRVVLLGIDHNPELEGYNRGHFCIGRNTDNVEIAFFGKKMNATATNAGGWGACEMRTWLNSTFYDALPSELKAVISPSTKYTDNVGGATNLADNVTATHDYIWIPAQFEVRDSLYSVNAAEGVLGARYDYYKNGISYNRYRHDSPTTAADYWFRSPSAPTETLFRSWITGGSAHNANLNFAFVPCFTIGGEFD